jgi:hypothetical protein
MRRRVAWHPTEPQTAEPAGINRCAGQAVWDRSVVSLEYLPAGRAADFCAPRHPATSKRLMLQSLSSLNYPSEAQ